MLRTINKYIVVLLLMIAFLKAENSYSQNKWTLEQCINYALSNNIEIKQSELSSESSKETLKQSKASVLPSLNANASHNYNFGKTVDPFTNSFATEQVRSNSFSVSSSITIFRGFQAINTIKQNRLKYEASNFDIEKMKNDISLSIASAYLQILFNEELLQVGKDQVNISKEKRDRTKKLFEAGSLAKGSLLDAEAQLSSEELQLVEFENQLDISYLTLQQLLDLEHNDSFSIVKPVLADPAGDFQLSNPDQVFQIAVTTQPEIKSAETMLKSNIVGLNIARSFRSPILSLNGSYGTGYSGASKELDKLNATGFQSNGYTSSGDTVYSPFYEYLYKVKPFEDQLNDNINKTIGFHLTIPIFNGWQAKTVVSQAKIAIKTAEYSLELEKNRLRKNIQQAYADAISSLKKYNATTKTLEAYLESFKFINEKYDYGMATSVEYNEAWNNLKKAKSDLLQAKYDFIFKVKILDFYTGKKLSL